MIYCYDDLPKLMCCCTTLHMWSVNLIPTMSTVSSLEQSQNRTLSYIVISSHNKCSSRRMTARAVKLETPPVSADCKVDLAFLMDGSWSIGKRRFKIQKDFLADVAQTINVGVNGPMMGIIQYGYCHFSNPIFIGQWPPLFFLGFDLLYFWNYFKIILQFKDAVIQSLSVHPEIKFPLRIVYCVVTK